MAWMWWLLAPVASTALGAALLWWRSRREPGSASRAGTAMREHQAVLRALSRLQPDDPPPATMLLIDAIPAE
jgi:hypothetical protein